MCAKCFLCELTHFIWHWPIRKFKCLVCCIVYHAIGPLHSQQFQSIWLVQFFCWQPIEKLNLFKVYAGHNQSSECVSCERKNNLLPEMSIKLLLGSNTSVPLKYNIWNRTIFVIMCHTDSVTKFEFPIKLIGDCDIWLTSDSVNS